MVDFVEMCNVCVRKVIIEAAKRIINSDKVCHSYSDLNFGVTFLEHSVYYFGRVCPSVCLSGDNLESSYSHGSMEYGSSSYIKVIASRSRSQEQQRSKIPISAI